MRHLIRVIIPVLLILTACDYRDKGGLKDEVLTLDLTYIPWACDCANWVTEEDIRRYQNNEDDSLAVMSIFIEPASDDLALPDTLGYTNDRIRFTGSFYEKRGFPAGYQSIERPDKARVFRYTAYQVLSSHYHPMLKSKGEK